MKYLLDTCVVSELIKKNPEKKVVTWIEECPEDALYLCVITLGEIQKGIAKLKDPNKKHLLQAWLDADLRERFNGRILVVNEDTALTWGQILGENELQGRPLQTIDSLIGAVALTNNLTVVTRDINDIEKTGARVLNPWL
ncbi:MAG: recombinase [Candidatus Raymondbacteria bacterium RifOxyC12_full_50_8]|uniref:Recombinase n=1 Tax=Candidatus Raymondbacteria bacterium RIFOXYD12_FULL_49_13 TaxID=1817890 RepID=A0A1F7FLY5_UNCRA|nr:MAG: recombinase [Candidatus Raymondbacteria bacterium RIFOXYA2_FULL_49_16]OGK07482.1 MAG: recombinase [Candidatus Raymondbacteria bacterium RIFOXYD12_FULL_49_13]OGK07768.1 MAG: recombinase [Candidatus Raymondbacteria bacterium RifOxyC12_full_50_8]OGP43838.1 MAG: recombinase [Candidatus Raymondbacteria bacterium RIFOXYB2_FULL_49_35]